MVVVDISDTVRGTTTELRLNGSIFSPTVPFYATLSPKMLYEEFEVDSINCWAIEFVDDGLFIMPQSKKLNFISGTTSQKVIITIPTLAPIPNRFNRIQVGIDVVGNVGIHLFRTGIIGNQEDFVASAKFFTGINTVHSWIYEKIGAIEQRSGEILVAVVTEADPFPEFKRFDQVFSDDYLRSCPRILVVKAMAFYPNVTFLIDNMEFKSSNIPPCPRIVANWAAKMLTFCSPNKRRYFRRLIKVGINGGVAINMLDVIPNCQGEESLIRSFHFSKIAINLCKSVVPIEDLKGILNVPLINLEESLGSVYNEASLCGLFWNDVLVRLFHEIPKVCLRFMYEWPTYSLYKNFTRRKVDFCALFQLSRESESVPILVVEAGKDEFTWEGQHKDCSKLLEIMSANCLTLAHQLIDCRKSPESVRVYGMLVGGLRTQLCVARPVLEFDGSKFYVHAEITFREHWLLDLGDGSRTSGIRCNEACCMDIESDDGAMEWLQANLISFEAIKKIVISRLSDQRCGVNSNEYDEKRSFVSEERAAEEMANSRRPDGVFDMRQFNFSALQKLERFVFCVKRTIETILNAPDLPPDDQFHPKYDAQFFSQSLRRGATDTPCRSDDPDSSPTSKIRAQKSSRASSSSSSIYRESSAPAENWNMNPSADSSTFKITKNSLAELNLYRKLWAYSPSIFARVYEVKPQYDESKDEWAIGYTFERLLPLFDERGSLSNVIRRRYLLESIKAGTKFAIDVLFGLHLLHKQFGMIHCDLSPGNIMFSEEDCIWKLIDFNLSKPADECLRVSKFRGGTESFIAPECEAQGIYSEASDIFALGEVIYRSFASGFILNCEEETIEEDLSFELFSIQSSMVAFDAKSRPTVIEALKKFLNLLRKIEPDTEDPIYKEQIMISIDSMLRIEKDSLSISKVEIHDKDTMLPGDDKDIEIAANIIQPR